MLRKRLVDRHQVGDVETAVQRGHVWDALSYRQGKVQVVDMKMEEVKSRCLPKHVLEQHHAMRQLIYTLLIQAQRTRTGGDQVRLRDRIAAGKQGHLMALTDEFLRQIGDNTFSATVTLGWHAFEEGSDLRDLHWAFPLRVRRKTATFFS